MLKYLVLVSFFWASTGHTQAQTTGKAFAASLLMPGLGQRYANQNAWNKSAVAYSSLEAGLWIGLVSSIRQAHFYTDAYQNFAQVKAGVNLEGKTRTFFVRIGNYNASTDFVTALNVARLWDSLPDAQKAENAWAWASEADRIQYVNTRTRADALDRQRTMFIGFLVANRLISAVSALRMVRKQQKSKLAAVLVPHGEGVVLSLARRF